MFSGTRISKIEARLEAVEAETAVYRAVLLCISTSLSSEDRQVLAMAVSSAKASWDLSDDIPEGHKAALTRVSEMIVEGVKLADVHGLD